MILLSEIKDPLWPLKLLERIVVRDVNGLGGKGRVNPLVQA